MKTLYIHGGPKDKWTKGKWFVAPHKERWTNQDTKQEYLHKDGKLYGSCDFDEGFFKTREEAREAIRVYKKLNAKPQPVKRNNLFEAPKPVAPAPERLLFVDNAQYRYYPTNPVKPHDVYTGQIYVPEGYRVVGFRIPKTGDTIIHKSLRDAYTVGEDVRYPAAFFTDKPRLIIKKFDPKQPFKAGDKVRVVKKVKSRSNGWKDVWMPAMDHMVGKTYTITGVDNQFNSYLISGWGFPAEALEQVD